jgi:hypothetical protein
LVQRRGRRAGASQSSASEPGTPPPPLGPAPPECLRIPVRPPPAPATGPAPPRSRPWIRHSPPTQTPAGARTPPLVRPRDALSIHPPPRGESKNFLPAALRGPALRGDGASADPGPRPPARANHRLPRSGSAGLCDSSTGPGQPDSPRKLGQKSQSGREQKCSPSLSPINRTPEANRLEGTRSTAP